MRPGAVLGGEAATEQDLQLVPFPHEVSYQPGAPWRPLPGLFLHIPNELLSGLRPRAQTLADQWTKAGLRTQLTVATGLRGYVAILTSTPTLPRRWEDAPKALRGLSTLPEGYRLTVAGDGAMLQANEERGFYYAGQTLRQLLEEGPEAPCLVIEDAPLLPVRGLHLDLRGWPLTRPGLERFIEGVARYKFNLLVLEYGGHFGYVSQPGLAQPEALAPAVVAELDVFARDRGVVLAPLLHGLVQAEDILRLPACAWLREHPAYAQQFCPSRPETLQLFAALADELMAVHTGQIFHAGGGRSWFLGQCAACQTRAKELGGPEALYLEYVGRLTQFLAARGRHAVLWDPGLRDLTDEQLRWIPSQALLVCHPLESPGGQLAPAVRSALERYRGLGREVWGGVICSPAERYSAFEQIEACGEAVDAGLLHGCLASAASRAYGLGPLHPPPELAWPTFMYAAERAWGGMKNTTREAFLPRVGASLFGLQQPALQQKFWSGYDLFVREYRREARDLFRPLQAVVPHNRQLMGLLEAWCGVAAVDYYLDRFGRIMADQHAQLQAGTGDPFHCGRLRFRIEDLRSRIPDLAATFRKRAGRYITAPAVEEFLNNHLACGLQRINEWLVPLAKYPLPDKAWQSPVHV